MLGITGGQSLLPIGGTEGKTGTRRSFIQSISGSVSLMNDSDLHMSDGGCKHDTHTCTALSTQYFPRALFGSRCRYCDITHRAPCKKSSSRAPCHPHASSRKYHLHLHLTYHLQGTEHKVKHSKSVLRKEARGGFGLLAEQSSLTRYEPNRTFVPHNPGGLRILFHEDQAFALHTSGQCSDSPLSACRSW